jgi:hypothetical protein
MATTQANQLQGLLAQFTISLAGVSEATMTEVTPVEVILGESLLTPGLQTSVRCHSYVHSLPLKNLDEFKGSPLGISIERKCLAPFGITSTMEVAQRVYRMEKRNSINSNVEEFILHACDQTLLNDAATLVSKSWKCTDPSSVVRYVLSACAGADRMDIEGSAPARDYIAENIHPFQVVAQQGNVALAAGNDPSFVHYMTYENLGTHKFRSLYSLTRQAHMIEYNYSEIGAESGYGEPYSIMNHSFPCDFDLLSDILNGLDEDGIDQNSLMIFNPVMKSFSLLGNQTLGCGMGSGVVKSSLSNSGSASQQNSCPDDVQTHLLKRQARMALLEQDKIALRIIVPWNPELHAGKVIRITLNNKQDPTQLNYGSGDYLIVSMTHNLKLGGFSTTTMDCVSKTVGQGGIV